MRHLTEGLWLMLVSVGLAILLLGWDTGTVAGVDQLRLGPNPHSWRLNGTIYINGTPLHIPPDAEVRFVPHPRPVDLNPWLAQGQ